MNPGVYKPGPRAANIHKNFTITYGTTESDGSGTGTVRTSFSRSDSTREGSSNVYFLS